MAEMFIGVALTIVIYLSVLDLVSWIDDENHLRAKRMIEYRDTRAKFRRFAAATVCFAILAAIIALRSCVAWLN